MGIPKVHSTTVLPKISEMKVRPKRIFRDVYGPNTGDIASSGDGANGMGAFAAGCGGASAGAAAGAIIGSCVPIVGTAIGALVGGLFGAGVGGTIGACTPKRKL